MARPRRADKDKAKASAELTASPIASRTRTRGVTFTADVGNAGTGGKAPPRRATPAPDAPAVSVNGSGRRRTPAARAESSRSLNPYVAQRGTRRGPPDDARSVNSLDSEPQDGYDESSIFPSQTPNRSSEGGPGRSSPSQAAPRSSSSTPQLLPGQGGARVLEKHLIRLLDLAVDLLELFKKRVPGRRLEDHDPVWVDDVHANHKFLSINLKEYASGSPYILDEVIFERLGHPYGSAEHTRAKRIISVAHLADLLYTLSSRMPDDAAAFLEQLDEHLPDVFGPPSLFLSMTHGGVIQQLLVSIRIQLTIARLRAAPEGTSAGRVVAMTFYAGYDGDETNAAVQQLLGNQSLLKSSLGLETAFARDNGGTNLLQNAQVRPETMVEAYERARAEISAFCPDEGACSLGLDELATSFPYDRFEDSLWKWAVEVAQSHRNDLVNSAADALQPVLSGNSSVGHDSFHSLPPPPASSQHSVYIEPRTTSSANSNNPPTPQEIIARSTDIQRRGQFPRPPPPSRAQKRDAYAIDPDERVPDSQPPKRIRAANSSAARQGRVQQRQRAVPLDPSLAGEPSSSLTQRMPASSEPIPTIERGATLSAGPALAMSQSQMSPPPGSVASVREMTQLANAESARARMIHRQKNPRPPQTRTPWSEQDANTLISAVSSYEAKWSAIAKAVEDGDVVLQHPRDQQALRDKARLLKQDMLKSGVLLSAKFDLVVLGKKEREAIMAVGKNPYRTEEDVEDGVPTNVSWPIVEDRPRANGARELQLAASQDMDVDDQDAFETPRFSRAEAATPA